MEVVVMKTQRISFIVVLLIALLVPVSVQAKPAQASADFQGHAPKCRLPESNADGLEILSNYYPGYWWDHTDLTIAVQAHPSATQAQLEAVNGAIATWSNLLDDCFDGLITLTNITNGKKKHRTHVDIILHYNPTQGGVSYEGYAVCGNHKCNNIIVSSDYPPSTGIPPSDPEYIGWVTLHELGHALGLGRAADGITASLSCSAPSRTARPAYGTKNKVRQRRGDANNGGSEPVMRFCQRPGHARSSSSVSASTIVNRLKKL
jgi:hypothetical protein